MRNYIPIYLLMSIILFLFVGCSNDETGSSDETLTISAAASLSKVMNDLKESFEKEHSNLDITINLGGSGSLQQQIKQGAPVDIFFSAAEAPFQALVDEGFINKENHSYLIGNSLVLIAPMERNITSLEDLKSHSIQTVAIGTPESVPAGNYAKQTLIKEHLWDSISEKLVMSKDARQVLTYVETGNVDAGFVYKTDFLTSDKVALISEIDTNSHEQIVYPVGIVNNTKTKDNALLFYQFLQSDTAKQAFEKYGFLVLD